jgi:hypothetical protein
MAVCPSQKKKIMAVCNLLYLYIRTVAEQPYSQPYVLAPKIIVLYACILLVNAPTLLA